MTNHLTANQLKILAISLMFMDHFVAIFVDHDTEFGMILRVSGRIVAPIMCYLIAEGFYTTSNINKYLLRLFVFALISHIPYNIAFGFTFFQATSVMWGLFLGLFSLKIVKREQMSLVAKILIVGFCCILVRKANWNYISLLWILGFGIFRGQRKYQLVSFTLISIFIHIIPTFMNFGFTHEGSPHWYQFGTFLAIPFLFSYRGERGKELIKMGKYGFYIFYPAHLLFLFLLDFFTPLKETLLEVL
ncbi:MAG: TraX family protein [Eubacteriales bacterium]